MDGKHTQTEQEYMCNVHHNPYTERFQGKFRLQYLQVSNMPPFHLTPVLIYPKKQRALVSFNLLKQHAYCFSMALRTARVNSWVVALPPMSRVLCEPSAMTS